MTWLDTIGAAYSVLLKSLGEEITIRAVDGSSTATLRGIYDRRAIPRDINGTHGVDADYMIGVLELELPGWVQPAIDSVGVEIDVRTDALRVHEIHPDGAGMAVLMCGPRREP